MSNPIGLSRSGKLTTEAATLRVALDLAKLYGLSFGGKLNGEVMVEAVRGGYPTVEFDLSGEDLNGRGFRIARANLGGRLNWPLLTLDGAEFEFADGSTLGAAGRINLESRQVSDGKWHLEGAFARRFLPDGVSYSKLRATGQISGPLGAPRHSGELAAEDFSVPHLRPCRAVATWRGENLHFEEANLKLESGTAALELAPDATAVHYQLAMAYRGLGDSDKAAVHFEHRESRGSRRPTAGSPIRLPDPLLSALSGIVQTPQLYRERGLDAAALGNWPEAVKNFRLVVEAEPDHNFKDAKGVLLDLFEGEARDVTMVSPDQARAADFVITGAYSRWKEVMRKQLDPTRAMMTGKLKVKGDLATLMRYTRAANEMTECTTRIDIDFPDGTADSATPSVVGRVGRGPRRRCPPRCC